MAVIEWGMLTPGEANRDLQIPLKSYLENKYQSQVGLKDLDFDVNQDMLTALGLSAPFQTINQAELALRNHAIHPVRFFENDNSEHFVLFLDPRPVGFSGFMNCAIHSLGLTNHGLFEVGRYPATPGQYWQWFLHRRLASADQVNDWCLDNDHTAEQFMQNIRQAMIE